jgi:hypothetical protein
MRFNDVNAEHLGGGVVLFRNCIDLDWDWVQSKVEGFIEDEWNEMYKPGIDPETGQEIYVNRSGYFFGLDSINLMPKRASATHQRKDSDVMEFLKFMEDSKDKYLLKYLELFPLAFKCIWWKVKGHFLKYVKGVYLGTHSDVSADYIYGVWEPNEQLALRSMVTNLIYLNDHVDTEEELNGKNFTGGEHYFNYLDITYKPKKGDLLMFPSNYMGAHEVKMVSGGVRYSYLGWYSQGTPNPAVNESVTDPIKDPINALHDTNIYMPTLAQDFREYLKSKGYDESSDKYRITQSNY